MKKMAIAFVTLALIAAPVFAKELKLEKKAGDNTVTLILEKNPPVTGDNKALIEINDASGKPVKDAQIEIDSTMPAMPGMPAMKSSSKAQMGKDAYESTVNFGMPGSWNIEVKMNVNGMKQKVKYNVDVK